MTEPAPPAFDPEWLALREGADARARAGELAAELADELASELRPPFVIHDLGCGTGSMGRWLAPRLPGPQHWVLHDADPHLLGIAATSMPGQAADGSPVTVEIRRGDLTGLTAEELAGARVVTASALLDLLTGAELERLAGAWATVRCAVLLALSVVGRVELTPADPRDAAVATAFDAHQRRVVRERRLLGPDAVAVAAPALTRAGARVEVRPSPWRLGPDDAALVTAWLQGWVGAAVEQSPSLPLDGYLDDRLAAAAAGQLSVVVDHADLLARWP